MKPGGPPLPERPRLRPGCRFTLHEFGGGPSWVLENPATGKFFRMGLREERIVRRFDGTRSMPEILTAAKEADSGEHLSPEEVLMLIQNLMAAGLLEEAPGAPAAPPPAKPPFNPMFMRISLGNPDRVFGGIAEVWQGLPRQAILAVGFLLVLAGGYAVFADFERFQGTLSGVFSAANMPAFLVTFVVLKLLHETAHGVVCRRYGGHVPDAGLYFVFFLPLTYIDATATWRFPSKWTRILVSSAGMLAELVVAGAAALVWSGTSLGAVNTAAANAVVAASITTLLFNANPLMRFDGYFILADLTGIPNLYTQAGKASSSWLGWVILGLPRPLSTPRWMTVYGLACLVWRTTLTLGICIGAIALLHGIGLVLAALTLGSSYLPLLKRLPRVWAGWREKGLRISRLRLGILVGLAVFVVFVPVIHPPAQPAVIEPAERHAVRIQCPGFIRQIAVHEGETVAAGQLLVRLENPDEHARLAKLLTTMRRAEAMANILQQTSRSREMTQQLEQAAGLRKQAAEVEAYLATLSLTAPSDSVVYARDLEELKDTYLPTGREIMVLGSATRRAAHIALSENLYDRIRPKIGDRVEVFVPGRLRTYPGTVTAVESVATRLLRHEALSALAGGPLAVLTPPAGPASRKRSSEEGPELVDPHFSVTAELTGEPSESLRAGERGVARFPSAARRTLLMVFVFEVRDFVLRAAQRAESR